MGFLKILFFGVNTDELSAYFTDQVGIIYTNFLKFSKNYIINGENKIIENRNNDEDISIIIDAYEKLQAVASIKAHIIFLVSNRISYNNKLTKKKSKELIIKIYEKTKNNLYDIKFDAVESSVYNEFEGSFIDLVDANYKIDSLQSLISYDLSKLLRKNISDDNIISQPEIEYLYKSLNDNINICVDEKLKAIWK